MRRVVTSIVIGLAVAIGASVVVLGCCSTPDATVLPDDESKIQKGAEAVATLPAEGNTSPEPRPGTTGPAAEGEKPAGGYDQIVYQPLKLESVRDGGFHLCLLGDIRDDHLGAAAVSRGGLDALQRVGEFRLGTAADGDGRAVGGQAFRTGASDARAATGHEHGHACESAGRGQGGGSSRLLSR